MGSFVFRTDIPHSSEGLSRPIGTFWTPNSIDNSTKQRSHARRAYYDPVQTRTNLHLLTNTYVDEILFKNASTLIASGVKYTSNAGSSTAFVYAAKEVILAAGGVFTPHLLMLSGIGPKDELPASKITVKKDLPAVGSNFQDHQALYMRFNLSNQSILIQTCSSQHPTRSSTRQPPSCMQLIALVRGPLGEAMQRSSLHSRISRTSTLI